MKQNDVNFLFAENNMNELLLRASENDPAFCPKGCGRSYKGPNRRHHMRTHLIYACGVNPQFQCIYCLKEFRYKQSLQYHIASIHQKIST